MKLKVSSTGQQPRSRRPDPFIVFAMLFSRADVFFHLKQPSDPVVVLSITSNICFHEWPPSREGRVIKVCAQKVKKEWHHAQLTEKARHGFALIEATAILVTKDHSHIVDGIHVGTHIGEKDLHTADTGGEVILKGFEVCMGSSRGGKYR